MRESHLTDAEPSASSEDQEALFEERQEVDIGAISKAQFSLLFTQASNLNLDAIMPNFSSWLGGGKSSKAMDRGSSCKSLGEGDKKKKKDKTVRKCETVVTLAGWRRSSGEDTVTVATPSVDKEEEVDRARLMSSGSMSVLDDNPRLLEGHHRNLTSVSLDNILTGSVNQYPIVNVTRPGAMIPVNRLRKGRGMCSRCSSLASLASFTSLNDLSLMERHRETTSEEQIETVRCKLCLSDVSESDMYQIDSCQCRFCQLCMQYYVQFEINEGEYDISCPDANCPNDGVFSSTEIQSLVGDQLLQKHKQIRLDTEVGLDSSRAWCPSADCGTILNVDPKDTTTHAITCPNCSGSFCKLCWEKWHPLRTCEGKWLPDDNGLFQKNKKIKHCPMCNVLIERDAGCAQMMCKRCKHVFCWYCLASLDDDFFLRHYDKGPCKNKLGHSRASVIWHRAQVVGVFAGFGVLLLVASPILLLIAPCMLCFKCKACRTKVEEDVEDSSTSPGLATSLQLVDRGTQSEDTFGR